MCICVPCWTHVCLMKSFRFKTFYNFQFSDHVIILLTYLNNDHQILFGYFHRRVHNMYALLKIIFCGALKSNVL